MDPSFSVFIIVGRPVREVFEAVADPEQLSAYFTTGGAKGRLEAGKTVSWDFHDFPGAFPVEVDEVMQDEKIVLRWEAAEGEQVADGAIDIKPAGYQTTVTITFTPVEEGRTKVEIAESGWRDTEAGLKASYGNCMGWSQMLAALKAWKEYGVNLREGAYK
jgi:uncharacterized protein YndB with AHSA1/START domain